MKLPRAQFGGLCGFTCVTSTSIYPKDSEPNTETVQMRGTLLESRPQRSRRSERNAHTQRPAGHIFIFFLNVHTPRCSQRLTTALSSRVPYTFYAPSEVTGLSAVVRPPTTCKKDLVHYSPPCPLPTPARYVYSKAMPITHSLWHTYHKHTCIHTHPHAHARKSPTTSVLSRRECRWPRCTGGPGFHGRRLACCPGNPEEQ